MDNIIEPRNDLVVIGIPLERFLLPEFVANRDKIISTLGKNAAGLIEMKGHRVDRNRDAIVKEFIHHPAEPDWLLFLDSDMSFPEDIGFRLLSARRPVIGGLYFHRSYHTPFVMTEHKDVEDEYGRMHRSWTFERQKVYDYLESAGLPMKNSAATIDGADGRIIKCDAVGTGAMMIHRSVLHALEPPWFEYRELAESEDLAFCWRVKHELGLDIYADLGTICGHYFSVPLGHSQFRDSFRRRGLLGSGYDVQTGALWIEDFSGILYGTERIMSYSNEVIKELWENRGDITDIEFYTMKEVGEAYLLDLLHWNESDTFKIFKNKLVGIEKKRVVVVGSGIGTTAIQLAMQGCSVYAYEANPVLRDFARKRWEWTKERRVHSPYGEIEWRGPFKRGMIIGVDMLNSIDLVVSLDTFEHMPEIELAGVLKYLSMMLKKGGRLFAHNNWGQQDVYPMHHDHSEIWEKLTEEVGLFQLDDLWLVKVTPMHRPILETFTNPTGEDETDLGSVII